MFKYGYLEEVPQGCLCWTKYFRNGFFCSATLSFNDGISSIECNGVYGLYVGYYTNIYCNRKDCQRIKDMNLKSLDSAKSARKRKRAIRKGYGDKDRENEWGSVWSWYMCCIGKIYLTLLNCILIFLTFGENLFLWFISSSLFAYITSNFHKITLLF